MTKEEIEALVQSALNAQKEQFDAEIGKRDAQISSLTAAVEATNSAKRAELETAVVASGLLDATNAKALPFEALDALAAKLKGVDASKFSTNSSDEPQGLSFDL